MDGCGTAVRANGLCNMHYQRLKRTGNIDPAPPYPETCTFPACEKPYHALGFCKNHYQRLKRTGNAVGTKGLDYFWSRLDRSAPCVERPDLGHCWTATGGREDNYAKVTANGRRIYAHRFAYEFMVGPIPDGMEIDHLCFNRRCVNPTHLEAVTGVENIRRAAVRRVRRARQRSG